MQLNTMKPRPGARKIAKRVGRGIGSGSGKTCGRGHKGQHSRSGGYHKVGFEGGQMPLQRRVPKFGFTSLKSRYSAEVRLSELAKLDAKEITLDVLKAAGVVASHIRRAKVIASGTLSKPVHLKNLPVTRGAKAAIESAGGKVEGQDG